MTVDLYKVDLLRERREQLGLPEPKQVDPRALLRKGFFIGGLLLGAVLGLMGWFTFRLLMLQQAADALEPASVQYGKLQQTIERTRGRINGLDASNKKLAGEILALPVSSAMLQGLARFTPAGVQLLDIAEKDQVITLKGLASDPMAFARVDVLLLQLSRSALFDPASVQLLKASQGEAAQAKADGQPAEQPKVDFEIRLKLSSEPPEQRLALYKELGSPGMSLRVDQLRREGLLP